MSGKTSGMSKDSQVHLYYYLLTHAEGVEDGVIPSALGVQSGFGQPFRKGDTDDSLDKQARRRSSRQLLNWFQNFRELYNLPARTSGEVDVALMEYGDYLFFEVNAQDIFEATLVALADKFSLAPSVQLIPTSRKSLTKDPLPWELLSLIALEIAMKFGPLYAATLMTMFFGDLRPGDTLMLKMKDITPPVSVHDVWAIHPRRYRGPRVMDSPLLQSWCGPVYASLHRWSKKNMPDDPGCNFAPFPFQ